MPTPAKKGDRGLTALYRGGTVYKDHVRVEACGTLDELSAFLGMAKSLIARKELKGLIESIQQDLFVVGAEVATDAKFLSSLKKRIDAHDVDRLEKHICEREKRGISALNRFCVPGEDFVSSALHVARAVARRAERRIVTLKKRGLVRNTSMVAYLNRLSGLLYLLARSLARTRERTS